jgi:hypothetical protein
MKRSVREEVLQNNQQGEKLSSRLFKIADGLEETQMAVMFLSVAGFPTEGSFTDRVACGGKVLFRLLENRMEELYDQVYVIRAEVMANEDHTQAH